MAMDYNIVILLVIVGAAAAALLAYGFARIYGNNFESGGIQGYSNEQMTYMREVRERNLEYLAWMMRGSKRPAENSSHGSYVVSLC